ncbi:MAG: DUF2147 domain-containing protein [Bacteroidales bacterium]|nr:DUF2147 domain-containing protein [Bacteroidales bacterium]
MKNFKSMILVTVLSLFSITVFSQTGISGKWNTGDQNTIVEIKLEDGVYNGKIISSDNTEVEHGKIILKEVTPKKNSWSGKIYAIRRGEWFDTEISISGNKMKLEMSVGFFSKTLEWTKHNP